MKLKTLFTLVFFSLFIVNSYAAVKGSYEIYLKGGFDDIDARSITAPLIAAQQTDEAVFVNFSKAIGTVNVKISSEDQSVYNATLDVVGASQYVIDITGYEPGVYVIEFTNKSNERIYGEFIIE